MKTKQNTQQIIEDLKSAVSSLNSDEREKFRDNLLAYLLFGDQSAGRAITKSEILKGITENERELIMKLAAQTEELYKAMHKNNDESE